MVRGIPLFANAKYENLIPFLSASFATIRLLAAPSSVRAPARVLDAAKRLQYKAAEPPVGISVLKRGSKRAVRGTLLRTWLRRRLLTVMNIRRLPPLRKFRAGY
ncbi:MAG: hypothetical protein QXX17_08360, partial [Conexivisphaerales archaeon]